MIQIIRILDTIAVITATLDFHPLHNLKYITSELNAIQFEGKVIFDLLAVNGLTYNRFVSMQFVDQSFDRSSFTVDIQVELNIKNEQDAIIKQDVNFLSSTILTTSEIQQFIQ